MFRPKKTIPKLTVAMLALTGCGDDGGASGGSGGTGNNAALLDAFCMKVAECYTDTVQECIDYVNDVILPAYGVDPNCPELGTYFQCGSQQTCEEMMADTCEAEFDNAYYNCD